MSNKPLTYLACPYSHWDASVKAARFAAVTRAAAWLMSNNDWNVFSPITHSHPLHSIAGMSGDWGFWARIDTEYIGLSARVIVLTLPGWTESTGVRAEIAIARAAEIPIFYLIPMGENNYRLADAPELYCIDDEIKPNS